jgi:hypothetical protein
MVAGTCGRHSSFGTSRRVLRLFLTLQHNTESIVNYLDAVMKPSRRTPPRSVPSLDRLMMLIRTVRVKILVPGETLQSVQAASVHDPNHIYMKHCVHGFLFANHVIWAERSFKGGLSCPPPTIGRHT